MSVILNDPAIIHAERPAPVLGSTISGEVTVRADDGATYRRSVCAIIMDQRGCFLGCRRSDDRKVLQWVQGGAKVHETVQQTAEREVFEEIGLPASYLHLIGEVLPAVACNEPRAPFRYKSKSWRKLGIVGQELYPLLYIVDTSVVELLRFRAVQGERREFCGAKWVDLNELIKYCSPSKREVVTNICRAVVPLARGVMGADSAPELGEVMV
ncbi:NUDIX hydrolase, partial [Trypanosoma grayi]|uniref:NUDIX hydrolase n=1 Tax=Trypanosoma grayi TaxID=71804 RepID=UPI0004F44B69